MHSDLDCSWSLELSPSRWTRSLTQTPKSSEEPNHERRSSRINNKTAGREAGGGAWEGLGGRVTVNRWRTLTRKQRNATVSIPSWQPAIEWTPPSSSSSTPFDFLWAEYLFVVKIYTTHGRLPVNTNEQLVDACSYLRFAPPPLP